MPDKQTCRECRWGKSHEPYYLGCECSEIQPGFTFRIFRNEGESCPYFEQKMESLHFEIVDEPRGVGPSRRETESEANQWREGEKG